MNHLLGLLMCGVILFLIISVKSAANLPDVHFSASTGECVEVRVRDQVLGCEFIPKKYNLVWVK